MKISLLTKSFTPISGGAERYATQLTLGLAELKHEIHVFCEKFQGIDLPNVIHHPIDKITPQVAHLAKKQVPNSILYSLIACYPVSIYRAGDGVHLHWQTIKYPNPILRTLSYYFSKRYKQLQTEKAIYSSSENCQRIITNSYLVKKHIEQYYPSAQGRIHVVYNGVNLEIFHPILLQERKNWLAQNNIPNSIPTWLFVANNWERKGLKTLLIASKPWLLDKAVNIIIVGRGNSIQWKSWLKKEGITNHVFFVGPSNEMPMWYSSSDLFILPTFYDPFANVCLEAMASGLPVITTSDNGASEIIQNGYNGYILDRPNDEQTLRKFLEQTLDHSLRNTMSDNALVTAKKFTMARNVQETLTVLNQIP